MKHIMISVLVVFFFIHSATSQEYQNLNAPTFKQVIDKNDGIILDVRTYREFANGHISQSKQLNFYAPSFRNEILNLPKDKPLYLYCNTGYRSRITASFLATNGFSQIYNLQRGIMEWNQYQYPVVQSADANSDQENQMKEDEFTALLKNHTLVLIDYYAPWCGPCRQMMPIIDSLATEMNDVITIAKINTDASTDLIRKLQISRIPYFVLYKNSKEVFTHQGLITKDALQQEIRRHAKQ